MRKVRRDVFVTSDGKEFIDRALAVRHEAEWELMRCLSTETDVDLLDPDDKLDDKLVKKIISAVTQVIVGKASVFAPLLEEVASYERTEDEDDDDEDEPNIFADLRDAPGDRAAKKVAKGSYPYPLEMGTSRKPRPLHRPKLKAKPKRK